MSVRTVTEKDGTIVYKGVPQTSIVRRNRLLAKAFLAALPDNVPTKVDRDAFLRGATWVVDYAFFFRCTPLDLALEKEKDRGSFRAGMNAGYDWANQRLSETSKLRAAADWRRERVAIRKAVEMNFIGRDLLSGPRLKPHYKAIVLPDGRTVYQPLTRRPVRGRDARTARTA